MFTRWRIEMLGGLRASRGEQVVTRFRTRKAGELLAYLAYHLHRFHAREELSERLWPELDREERLRRLTVELSSLRRQLEPPGIASGAVIQADRFSLRLNLDAVTTDVQDFRRAVRAAHAAAAINDLERLRRLEAAVALYPGELLPGYEADWCRGGRDQLAESNLGALTQLLPLLERTGQIERALEYAARAVEAEPLREETHCELMRLLAARGQHPAALQRYRRLRRLLRGELGRGPSPAAQQLAIEIEREYFHRSRACRPASTGGETAPQPLHPSVTLCPPSPAATVTLLMADAGASPFDNKAVTVLIRRFGTLLGCDREVLASFATPTQAAGCLAALRAASGESGADQELRFALHTAEIGHHSLSSDGIAMQQLRQLLRAAHPGQVLCSESTAVMLRQSTSCGVQLVDLGHFHLGDEGRDGRGLQRLHQLEWAGAERRHFPAPNVRPACTPELPIQVTRFFGREEELARLEAMLLCLDNRLVTLLGPGGSGKTRLAAEVAQRVVEVFRGAVWFVPLADLSDAGLIPDAILRVLGLPRAPTVPPLEQVVEALAQAIDGGGCDSGALLVLDNMEQLLGDSSSAACGDPAELEAVASSTAILKTLLERVPLLTCLVTSRQRLDLTAERGFWLSPLPRPMDPTMDGATEDCCEGARPDPEVLLQNPGVQLFVDRAQVVVPDFQLTRRNASAVARLCCRLEGMPLAIEMAAARAGTLTPAQMLAQLTSRFDLLVSRKRDAPQRHRSLHACIEWSYRLLRPELRRLFARLHVFRGGCTAEAASRVCPVLAGADPFDELVACSLLLPEESADGMRVRMLESLREYAGEQLCPDERTALQNRHAEYYLKLAERSAEALHGPERKAWLGRLVLEHDNLRAALGWTLAGGGSRSIGLRLAGALFEFWRSLGYCDEARGWLHTALATPEASGRSAARARALHALGCLGPTPWSSGRPLLEESLAISRAIGDHRSAARSLCHLALRHWAEGELGTARVLVEEAAASSRQLGDNLLLADALNMLGLVAKAEGDQAAARAIFNEGLEVARRAGAMQRTSNLLTCLAGLLSKRGDYSQARSLLEEALGIGQDLGDSWLVAVAQQGLGELARERGDDAAARALYAGSLRIWRQRIDTGGITRCALVLGWLARTGGEYEYAADLYREGLSVCARVEKPEWCPGFLEGMAAVVFSRDPCPTTASRAATLFGAASARRAVANPMRPASDCPSCADEEQAVRRLLGDPAFMAAREAGQALPWLDAIAFALSNGGSSRG